MLKSVFNCAKIFPWKPYLKLAARMVPIKQDRRRTQRHSKLPDRPESPRSWEIHNQQTRLMEHYRSKWSGKFLQGALEGIDSSTFNQAEMSVMSIEEFADTYWKMGDPSNEYWVIAYRKAFGMTYPKLIAASCRLDFNMQSQHFAVLESDSNQETRVF
jgi:hypothetical protein